MEAAAAREGAAANGGAAGAAGLAGALVDVEAVLETAGQAVDVAVAFVFGGGAAAFDTFGEDLADGVIEAVAHGSSEAGGAASGPEAGAEADLVGVDLADAGDDVLVHEDVLQLGSAAGEGFADVVGGEVGGEGLGAVARELGHVIYVVAGTSNESAEGTGVVETDLPAIAQDEDGGGLVEGRIGGEEADEAGHAEAEDEGGGAVGTRLVVGTRLAVAIEEEVGGLAAPADGDDAAAGDEVGEVARGLVMAPGAGLDKLEAGDGCACDFGG